jgi:hypothetical protein
VKRSSSLALISSARCLIFARSFSLSACSMYKNPCRPPRMPLALATSQFWKPNPYATSNTEQC